MEECIVPILRIRVMCKAVKYKRDKHDRPYFEDTGKSC